MSRLIKHAAVLASTAALVAGLAACSNTAQPEGQAGAADLEWGFWDQGSSNDTWKALAAQVSEENPDIQVKLTTSPFADYFTKLQSQLAAGTTPCIVSMQSLRLPAFKDALEPLGPLLDKVGFDESEWNAGALKALQVDGEQYAVPYGLSTMPSQTPAFPSPPTTGRSRTSRKRPRRSLNPPASLPSDSHSPICTCSHSSLLTTVLDRSPKTQSWTCRTPR